MLSIVKEKGKVIVRDKEINKFGEINCKVIQQKIWRIRLPFSIGGIKSINKARQS
jgi:hypothetical protein